jgi:hypothetical protein
MLQPTIHLEGPKCIVGCIFNSFGVIIAPKSPCMKRAVVKNTSCIALNRIRIN